MARKRREEREGAVSERSKSLDHPYCVHTNALFFVVVSDKACRGEYAACGSSILQGDIRKGAILLQWPD